MSANRDQVEDQNPPGLGESTQTSDESERPQGNACEEVLA
jgi:hypothetical protein